jgi:hypothetical protein
VESHKLTSLTNRSSYEFLRIAKGPKRGGNTRVMIKRIQGQRSYDGGF